MSDAVPQSDGDPRDDVAADGDGTGQLRQLQRLAMVGTLAAGLGHDLRNVVMPIVLRLDVLLAADLPGSARADVESIRESVEYLRRLANGLRLLSSDPFAVGDDREPTDLRDWWHDMEGLVVDAIPATCVFAFELPAGLPRVAVPSAVLAQVVLNLVMNARRAVEQRPDARITLTAWTEGDAVKLAVRDNGVGMDEEMRMRCFEPFFTTREREFATGLGLSVARSLMQRHGGDLSVSSALDEGAALTLHLPLAGAPAASHRLAPSLARVNVADRRAAAVIRLFLTRHRIAIEPPDGAGDATAADLIICDPASLAGEQERATPNGTVPVRQYLVLGDAPVGDVPDPTVRWISPSNLASLSDFMR